MNARTNIQIINGPDGAPAFVVIPYAEYVKQRDGDETDYIPHEVVSLMVDNEWSPVRAWREHLGLTQQTVAERLNISLNKKVVPNYARQAAKRSLRRSASQHPLLISNCPLRTA
jgi:hypothetical protein